MYFNRLFNPAKQELSSPFTQEKPSHEEIITCLKPYGYDKSRIQTEGNWQQRSVFWAYSAFLANAGKGWLLQIPGLKGRFISEARSYSWCQNLAAIPTTPGSAAGQLRGIDSFKVFILRSPLWKELWAISFLPTWQRTKNTTGSPKTEQSFRKLSTSLLY